MAVSCDHEVVKGRSIYSQTPDQPQSGRLVMAAMVYLGARVGGLRAETPFDAKCTDEILTSTFVEGDV